MWVFVDTVKLIFFYKNGVSQLEIVKNEKEERKKNLYFSVFIFNDICYFLHLLFSFVKIISYFEIYLLSLNFRHSHLYFNVAYSTEILIFDL